MRPMRLGVLCIALVAGAGSASFSDPAGDSGAAPDLTSVTVANDDQGLLTFSVTVANRSSLGPDDAVAIPFATNTPGKPGLREDGVNFVIGLEGDKVFLQRWNGIDTVEFRPRSLRASFAGGVATLAVRQDDLVPGFPSLAVPTSLSFYVLGIAFNGNDIAAQDDAPDATDEFWTYHLVQPPRIVVTYFRAPSTVRAGSRVVAQLGTAWADTGRAVKPANVSCRATLGGRALKGTPSGYANCAWVLPRDARGKTLRGVLKLRSGSAAVTRSFSRRVR
jgi:hypothetical protein